MKINFPLGSISVYSLHFVILWISHIIGFFKKEIKIETDKFCQTRKFDLKANRNWNIEEEEIY
jgi:hypothetical protein